MVRSHRVKEYSFISNLPHDSDDLFYPSWIDNYYPNRPSDMESTSLYDFLAWYDLVLKEPKESTTYYAFFDRYLKKRQCPYIINHYRYNPQQDPEKYFYAILLLIKPWRDCDSLIGECSNYTEAF